MLVFVKRKITLFTYFSVCCHVDGIRLHLVKSISCLHPLQECRLSNSSEKISISLPQLGQLQRQDLRFFNCSKPGQCCGGGHNAASCILHKNAYRFMGDEEKVAGEYTHVEKRPQAYDNIHRIGEGKIGTANIARH